MPIAKICLIDELLFMIDINLSTSILTQTAQFQFIYETVRDLLDDNILNAKELIDLDVCRITSISSFFLELNIVRIHARKQIKKEKSGILITKE